LKAIPDCCVSIGGFHHVRWMKTRFVPSMNVTVQVRSFGQDIQTCLGFIREWWAKSIREFYLFVFAA
jgi:hypothetical protein